MRRKLLLAVTVVAMLSAPIAVTAVTALANAGPVPMPQHEAPVV